MKSTELIQPQAMAQPIANIGTRNIIPETQSSNGLASISLGFPDETMISPNDGGLPPRGQDCNGMFYLSTDQRVFQQNGGIITFNQAVSDAIGGYPKNAVLDYIDENNEYFKVQSLIDDNTNNFVENPALIDDEHWKKVSFGSSSLSFPLGYYFYTDKPIQPTPYFLESLGQYNSGTMYPAIWNWLQELSQQNVSYVKEYDDTTITDYDYVINRTDNTFRLPIKTKTAPLTGNSTIGVGGTGKNLGVTNGTQIFGLYSYIASLSGVEGWTGGYGEDVGSPSSGERAQGGSIGITLDADNSGMAAKLSSANIDTSGLHLYFYVGNNTINQEDIDMGALVQALSEKTDKAQAALASMPSSITQELSVGASGTIYTAPESGYFCAQSKTASNAYSHVSLVGVDNKLITLASVLSAGITQSIFRPVAKNEKVTLNYSNSSEQHLYFIPAQGAKND